MRISKAQAKVLHVMASGETIWCSIFGSRGFVQSEWIRGTVRGWIYASTIRVLLKYGLIELFETRDAKYWRRDYRITEVGRKALEEHDAQNA